MNGPQENVNFMRIPTSWKRVCKPSIKEITRRIVRNLDGDGHNLPVSFSFYLAISRE